MSHLDLSKLQDDLELVDSDDDEDLSKATGDVSRTPRLLEGIAENQMAKRQVRGVGGGGDGGGHSETGLTPVVLRYRSHRRRRPPPCQP